MSKLCCIYREPGSKPDMSGFAAGTFTNGYLNELRCLDEFGDEGDFDLVVVAGGPTRYGGRNGEIVKHYVDLGTSTIVCELGRLIPQTMMLMLNGKPWLPPETFNDTRAEEFGFKYSPMDRGEDVLIVGQRWDQDVRLEATIDDIKRHSKRRIVYRPHPHSCLVPREGRYCPPGVDEISDDCVAVGNAASVEHDLDRAWCVVTHSSIVAVAALVRGIPVFASGDCVISELCYELDRGEEVEHLAPAHPQTTQLVLNQFSYTIWRDDEIRAGKALRFMRRFF